MVELNLDLQNPISELMNTIRYHKIGKRNIFLLSCSLVVLFIFFSFFEIEISDKKNFVLGIFLGNIILFSIFFLFQIKKMNSALHQAYKYQDEKEQTQEHMAIVGELTTGINHEIKNILCVAGLHSNQLSKKLKKNTAITPDEVLNSVQKIEQSLNRAEKIIKSVTRLSYDSSHDEKKAFSLYGIFSETQESAEYFTDKNKAELRISPITARLKIHCHPIQIGQVLVNLIKNSSEAIEELEERWVELKAVWQEEQKQVIITVTDSGSGIPESVREKLFQKQFSTKGPGKGTGLGLSISAKIIRDHGGSIEIDAKALHTTFMIKMPATLSSGQKFVSVDEAS